MIFGYRDVDHAVEARLVERVLVDLWRTGGADVTAPFLDGVDAVGIEGKMA